MNWKYTKDNKKEWQSKGVRSSYWLTGNNNTYKQHDNYDNFNTELLKMLVPVLYLKKEQRRLKLRRL
uniref:Uncharacterized protein n=1 Tax=Lepeophtheirus salmonis TaxID=72036 RepID=A0A0K2VGJ8_LEPSM